MGSSLSLTFGSEMGSGFTPAAKRYWTANEGASVLKRGKELGILWKDICPAQISKWLVVCLVGQSTTRVGCRIRAESINLFMICLRDPGTGKSPAFQQCSASKVACWGKRRYPLVCGWVHWSRTLPPTQGDTWPQGDHWKRRGVPFFEQLLGGSREKNRIDLERLIQLYNGGAWVYTRDDAATGQFTDNPAFSLSEHSQPNPFVPIYVKLKERKDSCVDRMIVYQPLPHRMAARETGEYITKLNDSPVKDFR